MQWLCVEGRFARSVAEVVQQRQPNRKACAAEELVPAPGDDVLLVLSSFRPRALERLHGKLGAGATLCCVMAFERYLFVSPRFAAGRGPCPACYLSRLISHPPPLISPESIWASSVAIESLTDFEYEGLPRSLAQLTGSLCLLRDETARDLSTAIDIGSLRIYNTRLAPRHRCRCRGRSRPEDRAMERFVRFVEVLQWPFKPC